MGSPSAVTVPPPGAVRMNCVSPLGFMSPRHSVDRAAPQGGAVMDDGQRSMMKRLLDRLLATRARRDREERHSAPWQAADEELHKIEHAIFRVPLEEDAAGGSGERSRSAPSGLRRQLDRAAAVGRRDIQGQRAH